MLPARGGLGARAVPVKCAVTKRPAAAQGQSIAPLELLDEPLLHQLLNLALDLSGQRPPEIRARQPDRVRQLTDLLVGYGAQSAEERLVKQFSWHDSPWKLVGRDESAMNAPPTGAARKLNRLLSGLTASGERLRP